MLTKSNKTLKESDAPRLIVSEEPKSVISEQFRTIRMNLKFSLVDKELRTLVVTSATPSSGKSTISVNLAATIASEDKKVLLVDADLRKPKDHKIFKVRNHSGLTSLLTNRHAKLESMVHQTSIKGLSFMTSGAIPPNPAELLGSNRMAELLEEMKSSYDLIIFDTPPVLAVTDSQVLASETDGVILVIPKGQVKADEVISAKEALETVKSNILGAVMNRVDPSNNRYNYYYASEE